MEFELGYTPNNLKKIREKYNLTQQQVAEIVEVSNSRTIRNWEIELSASSHRDMPLEKWRKLLSSINVK